MQEAFATGEAVYAEEMLPAEGQESVDLEYLSQRAGIFSQTLEDMDAYEAGTLGNSLDRGDICRPAKCLGTDAVFLSRNTPIFFTAEGHSTTDQGGCFFAGSLCFLGQNAGGLSKESVQDLFTFQGLSEVIF